MLGALLILILVALQACSCNNSFNDVCRLTTKSRNRYGEIQYAEAKENEPSIILRDNNAVWTIYNPSMSCTLSLRMHLDYEVRFYGRTRYLLSRRAAAFLPASDNSQSVSAVVEYINGKDSYYLLVADSRNYLQHCHGGVGGKELALDALKREIREELGITNFSSEFKKISECEYVMKNNLVSHPLNVFSTGYHVTVTRDAISHLKPENFLRKKISYFHKSEINTNLHEIEYVFVIPKSIVWRLKKFVYADSRRLSFNGDNHDILRLLSGMPPKFSPYKYFSKQPTYFL